MNWSTEHRPWPLPAGRWNMFQRWHDLLFAHWPLPVEVLRPLVPACLLLDTFDGRAWLGVVPFHMSGIRYRFAPPVPGLSAFPELNVRTYVTLEGRPGLFFLSLDAASPMAVAMARRLYHLPYFTSRMSHSGKGDRIQYGSERTHRGAPPAGFRARYGPTGPVFQARAGTLEHFLTERYCFYTVARQQVYWCEVHHAPWPLQPAEAEFERNTMALAHGIEMPEIPPLLHYSRLLECVFWPLRPLQTRISPAEREQNGVSR